MTEPPPYSAKDEYFDELVSEIGEAAAREGKRLPATPSREEIRQLLELRPGTPKDDRNHLLMRLLYATGVRVGELVAFKAADVTYEEQKLFVREGKGEKDRYVLADVHTLELLRAWQGDKPPEALLFDIEERTVQRVVEEYGELTGIKAKYDAMDRSFSPHSFRHAFATHCYENGMDLFTLKQLLGHNFLDTTQLYIETGARKRLEWYQKTHELAKS